MELCADIRTFEVGPPGELPWRLTVLQVDSGTEGSSLITEMWGLTNYCSISLFCDIVPVVVLLPFIASCK